MNDFGKPKRKQSEAARQGEEKGILSKIRFSQRKLGFFVALC